MFPLLSPTSDNDLELFQIWVNLPRATKMADPYFSMFWAENIPKVEVEVADSTSVGPSILTIVAGTVGGRNGPVPPPDSWASDPQSDLAILHLELQADHSWTLPKANPDVERVAYFYRGDRLDIGHQSGMQTIESGHGLEIDSDAAELVAKGGPALVMILQGRPIGEPVARYGPFVLNDREGLEQAFHDYQRTQFGGWPWDRDDPVHPVEAGRFALHPDGGRDVPILADEP